MTIQEAIKSGKPFRRKHWKIWLEAASPMALVVRGTMKKAMTIDELHSMPMVTYVASKPDILATDWVVKQ